MTSRPTTQAYDVGTPARTNSQALFLDHQPALDGLRGVAIILVLAFHALSAGETMGFMGVNLFFVLSGFLITTLLVKEWAKTGRISLRDFYIRRALRLLPALFLLLMIFFLYAYFFHHRKKFLLDLKEILVTFSYCSNWASALNWVRLEYLAHTWSLSVEEQFYLLWPLMLVVLLPKTKPKLLLSLILLAILASCLDRAILVCKYASASDSGAARLAHGLDTRADSLLMGCAVGVLASFNLLPHSERTKVWVSWGVWILITGLAGMAFFRENSTWMFRYGWFLMSLFSAIIILGLLQNASTPLARWLQQPALVYTGRISYGLYLWNWPVTMIVYRQGWPVWKTGVVDIAFTTLFAMASYNFVEVRFLRLKKRYTHATAFNTPNAGQTTPVFCPTSAEYKHGPGPDR